MFVGGSHKAVSCQTPSKNNGANPLLHQHGWTLIGGFEPLWQGFNPHPPGV